MVISMNFPQSIICYTIFKYLNNNLEMPQL